MDQRHWYLRAVLQFGWSKAELLRQISESAHEKMNFDVSTGTGYTDCAEPRQDDEDSFCESRHNLQESSGRVCNKKSDGKGGNGVLVSRRLCYCQAGRNRQFGLPFCPEETGGAWNLLCRPRGPAVDQWRLCGVRFADRHGPGQPPGYVPHLRRRLCRKDVPPDGSYRPSRQCSRPVVHRGFRGNLAGCAGGLPGVNAQTYSELIICRGNSNEKGIAIFIE